MPHPTAKKQRLDHAATAAVTFDDLSIDILANIFSFLSGAKEIMCKRRINKKSMEAVKKTIVPLTNLRVGSVERYNAINVMTRAMPNLQEITICNNFVWGSHKWSDGEDPDEEEAAEYANHTSHDIEIISNFSKLRILEIRASLNGRYPFIFNSFPLLQKLTINYCYNLKWDLGMLAGFHVLKELNCDSNYVLTGNITSLRVLKDTLEKVEIFNCENVEGNFMDLADFPYLKELELFGTAVTGDIRDIGENDFSSLEQLTLPKGVYGGMGYELQRIADAPDLVRTLYLLGKQCPKIKLNKGWYGMLSEDSGDWYESLDKYYTPPFFISFVEAGSRIGYRWKTFFSSSCEVNWMDPEPNRESSDYEKYIEKLLEIERDVTKFRGFHQPPSEEEYRTLIEDYNN
jgi:hypothetical protein